VLAAQAPLCKSAAGKFAAGLRIVVNYPGSSGIPSPRGLEALAIFANGVSGTDMETFLNLVWLAVTVTAIWLWRFRWSVSRRHPGHSTRMEAVAMVSVLALLFPVISLTDDLHPETVAVDAASGKRNACLIAASAPHVRAATIGSGTHLALGMISRTMVAGNLVIAEISTLAKLYDPAYLASSSRGRSPPTLL
jgi:hypothetical protein